MRFLFIGNSFTFFNKMPLTFLNMMKLTDKDAIVDTIAYGGYSLSRYADESTEIGKMSVGKIVTYSWDYIILQEQSLLPCTDPEGFIGSVKRLNEIISQTGAGVILYQTWAYKEGSEKLASTGMTYEEMNQRLFDAYARAAEAIGAKVAPVGEAFYRIYRSAHITHLFNKDDNYHPSASGSYLAACVLYHTVTGKSTIGLPCPSSVSLYNLSVIQRLSNDL